MKLTHTTKRVTASLLAVVITAGTLIHLLSGIITAYAATSVEYKRDTPAIWAAAQRAIDNKEYSKVYAKDNGAMDYDIKTTVESYSGVDEKLFNKVTARDSTLFHKNNKSKPEANYHINMNPDGD